MPETPMTPAIPLHDAGAEPPPELDEETPDSPIPVGPERLVGVRLPASGMIYRVLSTHPDLHPNDEVVVETRSGESTGRIIFIAETPDPARLLPGPVRRVLRPLVPMDVEEWRERQQQEREAREFCKETIRELGLDMKLSQVTFQPDGRKAVFFFTSEQRVDFRQLVRVLAKRLRIRVEMRQIGVRDETRLLGGVGPCGLLLCCAGYLENFQPVSVRMAKNQELSLNPDAISGVCGRLMCCLAYENETYRDLRQNLPKNNSRLWTREGVEVMVRGVQPLRGMVDVQLVDGSRQRIPIDELSVEPPVPTDPPVGDGTASVASETLARGPASPGRPGRPPPRERSAPPPRALRPAPRVPESAPAVEGQEEEGAAPPPAPRERPAPSGRGAPRGAPPPRPPRSAPPPVVTPPPEGEMDGEEDDGDAPVAQEGVAQPRRANRRRRPRRRRSGEGGGGGTGGGAPPSPPAS